MPELLTSIEPARATDTSPVTFFEQVFTAFEQAERHTGNAWRTYAIGGFTVRLRFAGQGLIPRLAPAFEHLRIHDEHAADLTICVWDSASARTRIPECPWAWSAVLGRGEVVGFNDDHIRTAIALDQGSLSLLDQRRDLAISWVHDARQLPGYERAAPLKAILNWWFQAHDRQMAHGGAVGTLDGAVLLVGRSGAGKSSTAISCALAGMLYLADDFCLLQTHPEPRIFSVYNSAKLEPASIHRFGPCVPAISNVEDIATEKALMFMHQHAPERVASSLPVRAILLPTVTGATTTTAERVSAITVLKELAPSSALCLPGASHNEFRRLADFVRTVPCYRLRLGTDPAEVAASIQQMISDLST
jgi:hypothetical protein